MGVLDGQNLTIEQNHTAATGNLPSMPSGILAATIPVVSVASRQAGYQVTNYYSGYATISAISADRLTLTISSPLNRDGVNQPQVVGGKIYKRINGTPNTNDTANSTLMGTIATAQNNAATTIVLNAPAPAGLAVGNNIGYSDNYMSSNLLRRNIVESAQTGLATMADNAVTIAEQQFRPIPGESREWELYGSWLQGMAASGNVIGPTA